MDKVEHGCLAFFFYALGVCAILGGVGIGMLSGLAAVDSEAHRREVLHLAAIIVGGGILLFCLGIVSTLNWSRAKHDEQIREDV